MGKAIQVNEKAIQAKWLFRRRHVTYSNNLFVLPQYFCLGRFLYLYSFLAYLEGISVIRYIRNNDGRYSSHSLYM